MEDGTVIVVGPDGIKVEEVSRTVVAYGQAIVILFKGPALGPFRTRLQATVI